MQEAGSTLYPVFSSFLEIYRKWNGIETYFCNNILFGIFHMQLNETAKNIVEAQGGASGGEGASSGGDASQGSGSSHEPSGR